MVRIGASTAARTLTDGDNDLVLSTTRVTYRPNNRSSVRNRTAGEEQKIEEKKKSARCHGWPSSS